MSTIQVAVVRVFTDPDGRFGNPLGIVDGSLVPPADRLRVATELDYSETVYVDDPETGTLQIFTPATELRFAGHPTVGTAWWLRSQGYPADTLRVPAGEIPVTRDGDLTFVRADSSWGSAWDWRQVDTPEAVLAADPAAYSAGHTFLWSWIDEAAGTIRARAFAPAMGIVEDEATGSAVTQLTAQLARDLLVVQGAGSQLHAIHQPPAHASVGGWVLPGESRTITI